MIVNLIEKLKVLTLRNVKLYYTDASETSSKNITDKMSNDLETKS